MAATALAQEKVWLDKSSYDKAERLHYEKLAKVLPQKIVDHNNIIENSKEEVDQLKSLKPTKNSKKSKKISFQDDTTPETLSQNVVDNSSISTKSASKTSKSSKKNNKIKEEVMSDSKKIVEQINNNGLKNEDSNNVPNVNTNTKKNKAKEAKEKKNKADKKTRNLEEDKNNQESKEQLTSQGSQPSVCSISPAGGSLANEVAKARQHIKQSLQCMDGIAALAGISDKDLASRIVSLEKENQDLRNIVQELKNVVTKLDSRVKDLEVKAAPYFGQVPNLQICPQKPEPPKEKAAPKKEEDDDDDVDLFGSDSEGEDAEAAKIREERLAAYAAKKAKKPALIAKSNIIFDIKPWDDETDMKAMEAEVRKITSDGLLWGAAKLAPVAYNIQKLQISCVVEDDKVSVDWLVEQIQEIEDYVQSVDIAAFNKI